VASSTLHDPQWNNTTVLEGDLASAVRELKERDGRELQVHGSGRLVQFLLANDLVDRLNLLVFPVIVGAGTRLFPDSGIATGLALEESRTTPSGVSISVYRPSGRPEFGSLEVT
jgi:dihydrofolate reductase